jgi:hypothetical protein
MVVAAFLAMEQSGFAAAGALAAEGLALAQAAGDRSVAAGATFVLGGVASSDGDETRATALFEEALHRFREVGERARAGWTLCNLAILGDLGSVEAPGNPTDQGRSS